PVVDASVLHETDEVRLVGVELCGHGVLGHASAIRSVATAHLIINNALTKDRADARVELRGVRGLRLGDREARKQRRQNRQKNGAALNTGSLLEPQAKSENKSTNENKNKSDFMKIP